MQHLVGPQPPPTTRGTGQIIVSMAFFIGISCWSLVYPNVPGPEDSWNVNSIRRTWLFFLALLGPEFPFTIALGQYQSARRSFHRFVGKGHSAWTMRHSFFADQGGFVLKIPKSDSNDQILTIPIDGNMLLELVDRGHVAMPTISENEIKDRDKDTIFIRVVTGLEISVFVIMCVSRLVHDIALTHLEVLGLANVLPYISTAYCLWYKTRDADVPIQLECSLNLQDILTSHNRTLRDTFARSPFEFISRREWSYSLQWNHWVNILRRFGISFRPNHTDRIDDRFENTTHLPIDRFGHFVVWLVSTVYASVFIAAWNLSSPTHMERKLNHIAAVGQFISIQLYFGIEWIFFRNWPYPPPPPTAQTSEHIATDPTLRGRLSTMKTWFTNLTERLSNNSDNDPLLRGPWLGFVFTYPVAFMYCVSKTYLYISALIEFRALPDSCYKVVQWTQYLPFF